MSYEDFVKYFSDIQVCRVHDDYHYAWKKSNTDNKHAAYFKFNITNPGHYYLTVNQESKRKHLKRENYQYSEVSIVFAKRTEDGGFQYIEGFQRADKEVWTDGELEAGEYVAYVKIDWYDQ
mmetsp:Transcript_25851/g.22773  ORF Transcript_25851/g.22773 Transcript_25851/m.22773 type:complete len:121 (+) Transcript_25851:1473-1835(+)